MNRMLLALGLVLLIACGSEAPPASPAAEGNDFSVTTFEGDRFSTADARGKPLVLNFWESW
jgi:cytochrome oxidase Cu insertion factor (SCO1/SenC/PrrC family)